MVNLDRDSLKYQVSRKDRKAYAKDAETAINLVNTKRNRLVVFKRKCSILGL